MKGNISLKDFITDVKTELKSAINNDDPFFFLDDVELEVSFSLNANAKGSAKFVVVDVGGDIQAAQTHKVKLKLTPFVEDKKSQVRKKPQVPKSTQPRLAHRSLVQEESSNQQRVTVGRSKKGYDSPRFRRSPTMKK
ncbi:hypothetical protein A6E09_18390 [Aliivibrio fischeri]|nr:hypothetical protein A6E09_18390 [Aliivibrio fischeri]